MTKEMLEAMRLFKAKLLFQLRYRDEFLYTQLQTIRETKDDIIEAYEREDQLASK